MHRSISVHTRVLLGASTLAVMAGGPAFGQAAPPTAATTTAAAADGVTADARGLDDIMVTARKVSENLQVVPVAVTAFTGDDLLRQNAQQVQDIAKFTPGLSLRPGSSSPVALTLTLRGQVQTDILATLDPSVGTYVDGVYWARAYGLNGDFLDVLNVQVLKGPQGTLFGRNTTGGALLINSNNPDLGKASGRATLTYGRFNEFQATGVLNFPIVADKLGLRVAVQRSSRDGYTTNVVPATAAGTVPAGTTVVREGPFAGSPNGLKYDNRNRWQGRAKLEFKPTEDFSVLLSAEYFDLHERAPAREIRLATSAFDATAVTSSPASCTPGGATLATTCANSTFNVANTAGLFVGLITGNGFPTAAAVGNGLLNAEAATLANTPRTTANNDVPYVSATTYTYGATASLDTSFGNVKLITAHRKVKTYAGVDLEGSSFPVHFTEGQQTLKQNSVELQATGNAFGDAVAFAVGGFYFDESGFDQSISIVVAAINPNTSHFYGAIDNKSIGAYGQATWKITDALSATAGVRYSQDTKGLETRNNNFNRVNGLTTCSIANVGVAFDAGGEVVGPAQCGFKRKDKFDGFSYTAGIDYKVRDDVLVYAKTAKGFRSGGQNLRAPLAAFFIPFQPETAYSYELGLKSELFDRRVRVNLAAYTTTINNIQRSTLVSNPQGAGGSATIIGNAGKARFNGIEAELQVIVFDGFRVSASGTLTDPKYVKYSDLSGDRSFERFTSVAKEQFSLAADYTTNLGFAKVSAHIDYAWLGDTPNAEYNFPANPENAAIVRATTQNSQGLVGARLGASFAEERFEVAVFGRNITNDRSYINSLFVAPLGYVSSVRYEPATYGITGTVRF